MKELQRIGLYERGDRKGLVRKKSSPDDCDLLSFLWMDRDRRYFISSCSSLSEGIPYDRMRWRQVDDSPNAESERVQLTVRQTECCELYYAADGKVDSHNRKRQYDLNLEKKLGTHDWSKRANMSILGVCIVDTYLSYQGIRMLNNTDEDKKRGFYLALAEEMIDNMYDSPSSVTRHTAVVRDGDELPLLMIDIHGEERSGVDIHVTPTKDYRKNREGVDKTYLKQGHCLMCKKKTIHVCSGCTDNVMYTKDGWVCHTKTKRMFFPYHVNKDHLAIEM